VSAAFDTSPPVLDVTGYRCPIPVIRMEAKLRRMPPGAQILVRADDPIAAIDIPQFCREAGHSAVRKPDEAADGPSQAGPVCVFMVTRGPNPA